MFTAFKSPNVGAPIGSFLKRGKDVPLFYGGNEGFWEKLEKRKRKTLEGSGGISREKGRKGRRKDRSTVALDIEKRE